MSTPMSDSARNKPPAGPTPERPNSLGWTEKEISVVLDALEVRNGAATGSRTNREHARWPFRRARVLVKLVHPGGTTVDLRLAGRNISRGGAALLHNTFVHTGTRCSVFLPRLRGGASEIQGVVRRCVHVRAQLHEIGVAFDQCINLHDFVPATEMPDFYSFERVNPDDLVGRILCVDDSEVDLRLLKHHLSATRLEVSTCLSGAEAVAQAPKGFDVILTDWLMPDMNGADLIAQLRTRRVETPAIIATVDPLALLQTGMSGLSNTSLLSKPFTDIGLFRAIAEHLLLKQAPSQAAPTNQGSALLGMLESFADQLRCTLRDNDLTQAMVCCVTLRSKATSLGAIDVADAAKSAIEALNSDNAGARQRVEATMQACKDALRTHGA